MNTTPTTSAAAVPTPRPAEPRVSPGRRLRELFGGPEPGQLMGVHDGLSARIAVEEGFDALWASGLCMSTALGVRDSDEASWNQLLTVVETIVDAAGRGVPVLVDGDTGYGNFNTARRFAQRAERVGAAGVCFEDKTFPKMNSFCGDGHVLAPIDEFCGKIRACKDVQDDDDFVIVARTETLIAGRPVSEALERGEAYAAAGADALFVHSRSGDVHEIAAFAQAWDFRIPVVVAPTTYHTTPMAEFRALGLGGVIWANHPIRAAFTAMRHLCREVRAAGGVSGVESDIASIKEIFALLSYEQLEHDEETYSHWDRPAAGTGA